jgi:hypothetical protein
LLMVSSKYFQIKNPEYWWASYLSQLHHCTFKDNQ